MGNEGFQARHFLEQLAIRPAEWSLTPCSLLRKERIGSFLHAKEVSKVLLSSG